MATRALAAFRTGQEDQSDPRGSPLGRRYLESRPSLPLPLAEMGGADRNLVIEGKHLMDGRVLLATAGLPEAALPFHLLSGLTPALSGRA